MKMYKKSELNLNNGLLVSKDGDIVMPDICIVNQANYLETLLQETEYLAKQPEATPMPSLDGFKRTSIKDSKVKFTATTPLMDMKQHEAMAIMDELDDMLLAERANNMLDDFKDLIDFVDNDFVVDCGSDLYYFDTPMLGSVLELDKEGIVDVIAHVCGMNKDGITKHDVLIDPLTGDVVEDIRYKDEDAADNGGNGETVVESLTNLAHDVEDLCNNIEE